MPEMLKGPVEVVGAGLLGTSIALALRKAGVEVWLSDINSEHVRTASGLGAGIPRPSNSAAFAASGPERSLPAIGWPPT